MKVKVLDADVLENDRPNHGLNRGDVGAVIDKYERDGLEFEFVTAIGRTQAIVTLKNSDARPVADTDSSRAPIKKKMKAIYFLIFSARPLSEARIVLIECESSAGRSFR